jgi:hypothetical protein
MQDILKRLVTELHEACFKPNGFKKTGGSFLRMDGVARQKLKFSSSRWNSANSPVEFSIYIWLAFTDITHDESSPYSGLPLSTYITHLYALVPETPPFFKLTADNYESIKNQILVILPRALLEWPKHYEPVRSRLKKKDLLFVDHVV